MKKNKIAVCILNCTLLITLLGGCGSSQKSLSGKYIGEKGSSFSSIEFFADGKYTSSHSNYEGNYSIDGNRIRLEGILVDSKIYYFRTNKNTLELSYDEDFESCDIYTKQ